MGKSLTSEQGLDFTGKAGVQLRTAVEKHYQVDNGQGI